MLDMFQKLQVYVTHIRAHIFTSSFVWFQRLRPVLVDLFRGAVPDVFEARNEHLSAQRSNVDSQRFNRIGLRKWYRRGRRAVRLRKFTDFGILMLVYRDH